ncbi:MAG: hypothetical protein KUG70_08950 [Rhodobacteraceae bacterium]|nr:hypothetical protein [Paracoccaceae bacterium]
MKCISQIILALSIAAVPQTGHAFAAANGLTVEPVNSAVFEVNDSKGARAPAYWCAAANYAMRELKAGWKDKLYVARTMGHSAVSDRGNAVQFTVDPAAAGVTAAGSGSSMESFVVGDNMTLQQANTYCH